VNAITAGGGESLRICAPAYRAALKSGKAITEDDSMKLDERALGKLEDNVYW